MIFVDSNIWCYYFDQRLPEHQHVKEPMRKIIKSTEIACNTIIVIEVAHYLVRHFNEKTARKKIELFTNLRNLKIANFDRQAMTETIENLIEHAYADGLGGRDATIITTMKAQNMKRIASHDDTLKRIACKLKLEVTDPAQTPPQHD
jgi:predicted nucleic acid-binding protein